MEITLYSFNKRVNSTARPSGQGRTEEAALKDATSILKPTLILELPAAINIEGINYCYISRFIRYYWITDWVYNRGVWEAACLVDPLGSWKEYIGDKEEYILRSSYTFDTNVIDKIYPAKAGSSTIVNECTFPWNTPPVLGNGSYVVGVANGDDNSVGGTCYYVLNDSQFTQLRYYLTHNGRWYLEDGQTQPTDTQLWQMKQVFNPFQYFTSVMWYPFNVPTGASGNIELGWWDLKVLSAAHLNSDPVWTKSITAKIPKHPQSSRGLYLNSSPYTQHTLICEPFGAMELDTQKLYNYTTLTAVIRVDCTTGGGNIDVYCGDAEGPTVVSVSGQVGVQMSMAQISSPPVISMLGGPLWGVLAQGAYNNAPSSVQNALTSGATSAMSFLKGASSITGLGILGNAVDLATPQLSSGGANGSIAAFIFPPRLVSTFKTLVDEDNSTLGRPLCQLRRLSTIPGYILCRGADCSIPGTTEEADRINAYLDSGIFYE